jgi:hypothetical protein
MDTTDRLNIFLPHMGLTSAFLQRTPDGATVGVVVSHIRLRMCHKCAIMAP